MGYRYGNQGEEPIGAGPDSGRGRGDRTDRLGGTGTKRRQLLRATAGASLGAALAGCLDTVDVVGSGGGTDELRIGVLDGTNLEESQVAAKAAADRLNEDGGIDGREVTIVSTERNTSPLEARRNYHRSVLEEDVDLTVGISSEGVLDYLVEDIAEQERLHFTTGIGAGRVADLLTAEYETYKYHFRTGPLSGDNFLQNHRAFITEMFPKLGWNSVALLMEDYSWNEGVFGYYLNLFEEMEGIDVVYPGPRDRSRYRPSRNDFTEIYETLENRGADVAWVGMAQTGNRAVRQWADQEREFAFGGIHVPMQLPDYYDDLPGDPPRYALTSTTATAQSELTEETPRFVERYRDRAAERSDVGSDPIYTGYNVYDSILAYERAVDEAGTFDTDAVIEELKELSLAGATGVVEYYDEDAELPHDRVYDPNDNTQSGSVYFQWQENENGEGVQEVIWPEDVSTAEYEEPHWF